MLNIKNGNYLPDDFILGKYASGDYAVKCKNCGEMMSSVDKRATSCLHCAIINLVDYRDNLKLENNELKKRLKISKITRFNERNKN